MRTNMNKETISIVGLILLILAAVVLGPLATIFSVNTLFATAWAYSFKNWFAVVWLQMLIYGWFKASTK